MNNSKPLLEVKGLKTYFYTEDGIVRAVDGVTSKCILGRFWVWWVNQVAVRASHRFRSCA